jgi:hypothetical protein
VVEGRLLVWQPNAGEKGLAVIASEAKQSTLRLGLDGLLRRYAPRNDGKASELPSQVACAALSCAQRARSSGLVVRDARRCRAPHHEGHVLPSSREAAGRGGGSIGRNHCFGDRRTTPHPRPLPATRDVRGGRGVHDLILRSLPPGPREARPDDKLSKRLEG